MAGGKPKSYQPNKFEKACNEYFEHCDETGKPYTISGLALFLKIDRKTLVNYSREQEYFPTIKEARERVQAQLEENALSGKGHATFTIFNLKNNFGWKDQQEVEVKQFEKVEELLAKIKEEANDN